MQGINQNEKIKEYLLNNNYLNFIKFQKGVFRKNCIDSLDRSNVVQSTFARFFLFKILYELIYKLKGKLKDEKCN